MNSLARILKFIGDDVPAFVIGKTIGGPINIVRGITSGALGLKRSAGTKGIAYGTGRFLGESVNKGVKRLAGVPLTKKVAEEVVEGATEKVVTEAAKTTAKTATDATKKVAGEAVNRTSKHTERLAGEAAKEAVEETAKVYNPYAEMSMQRAGIALGIGIVGLGAAITKDTDVKTSAMSYQVGPNGKMQRLYYSGNSYDDLGADGDLALALHYNRHG